MQDKTEKDLLAAIQKARCDLGLSQAEVARQLDISQGHLSKILSENVPFSNKVARRARSWLATGKGPSKTLEEESAAALRQSPSFRALVEAALQMHKNA